MTAGILTRSARPAIAAVVALLCLTAVRAAQHSTSAVPAAPDDRTILHVLNRLGYGARPGDVDRIRQAGLQSYIDQQLSPEGIADTALDARLTPFTTLAMTTRQLADEYFIPVREAARAQQQAQRERPPPPQGGTPAPGVRPAPAPPSDLMLARRKQAVVMNELAQARLLRATLSERQLQEVLVDFWFNHFNVFVGKGQVREYLPEYERDVIRPRVLGSFRDLLGAVAHSPAMLFYLDNWRSGAPASTPAIPARLRERLNDPQLTPQQRLRLELRLQQLRTQRPSQTRGLNENYARELMELHTLGVDGGYTQRDVVEVARAFTGWTIDRPQQGGGFVFRAAMHDRGEKTILGRRFSAGHGKDEGERVLDILAAHPSTAQHISRKLAQRFVADEPPPALVDRAARVFLSTRGDLREVVRTIVTSPEFFAPDVYRAKVKTPLEFVVSAARASNAAVNSTQMMTQALRTLGMPLYGCQPPTGYSTTADAWVNTGALLNRMNFALAMVSGQARGLRVPVDRIAPDTSGASHERAVYVLLGGDVSDSTRQTLARADTPEQLLALVLGSPDFQRR